MTLPRNLSGEKLAVLLRRYGYEMKRQTGSHMRLTSTIRGQQHHITIPNHKALRTGTLHSVLSDIAGYLQIDLQTLRNELFK